MEDIKKLFGEQRIVGLAGKQNSGKTNNLMALIRNFRKENKKTPVYVYGLNEKIIKWLDNLKLVFEISNLEQLSDKTNSLIIIDEFQKLRLNDRRYKDVLNRFIDFIYHNNNWVILSSPNTREFNSIIGGKIDRWALKSLRISNLVNGSQLKDVVMNYHGRFKSLSNINVPKNKILIINDDYEKIIELEYIKEIDFKKDLNTIFKKC